MLTRRLTRTEKLVESPLEKSRRGDRCAGAYVCLKNEEALRHCGRSLNKLVLCDITTSVVMSE